MPVGIKHQEVSMQTKRFFVFGLPVILPVLGRFFVAGDDGKGAANKGACQRRII
jgi:hypothetical protein